MEKHIEGRGLIAGDSGPLLRALESQGRKNDEGKLRYDLIPTGPLEELARVYTIGAKKYADQNWRKGFKWGRVFGALCRHAFAWWSGERSDPTDGQHHLASVAWCAFALMEFEHTKTGEDDRWVYSPSSQSLESTTTSGGSIVEHQKECNAKLNTIIDKTPNWRW